MNKLKELKEYIQKEIPEISNCPICGSEKGVFKCSRGVRNCADCMQYVGEIKISLEDVLRVFHKGLTINENDGKRQTKMRDLTEFYLCPDGGVVDPLWEFGKPLDQQSEKTIEFLHELLIKNK